MNSFAKLACAALLAASGLIHAQEVKQEVAPATAPAVQAEEDVAIFGLPKEVALAQCKALIEMTEANLKNQAVDSKAMQSSLRDCFGIMQEAIRISRLLGNEVMPATIMYYPYGEQVNVPLPAHFSGSGRLIVGGGLTLIMNMNGGLPDLTFFPFVGVVPFTSLEKTKLDIPFREPVRSGFYIVLGTPRSTQDISGWYTGLGFEQARENSPELRNYRNSNYAVYGHINDLKTNSFSLMLTKYSTETGGQELNRGGTSFRAEAIRLETADLGTMGRGLGVKDLGRLAIGAKTPRELSRQYNEIANWISRKIYGEEAK